MQHDELAALRKLREEIRWMAEVIDRAIAWREDQAAEEKRKSGILIIGPWVAAAMAGVGAAWRWVARNSTGVAAFGAGAALAAVGTVGIEHLVDDPPSGRHVVTAPAPPTGSAPPPGHTPSPTGPPKDRPSPPPPPVTPTPTPGPGSPGVPQQPSPRPHKPPGKPAKPPHTPPGKPPTAPPADDGNGSSPAKDDDCRINLPHLLGHGLLCGHLAG